MPGQVKIQNALRTINKITVKADRDVNIKAAYILVNGQKQLWFQKATNG